MAEAKSSYGGGIRPLYAVTIQHTIAGGDLAKMRSVATEAEKHVAEYGDVSGALAKLKAEIARAEGRI